jgi:hypothetical protein
MAKTVVLKDNFFFHLFKTLLEAELLWKDQYLDKIKHLS